MPRPSSLKAPVLIFLFLALALVKGPVLLAEEPTPWCLTPEELHSQAAILMDAETGQILFEKNMHESLPPASITKILTALIAIEEGQLEDQVLMSREAVFSIPRGSSHIALDEGEVLPLSEALYAMMLVSANDAANGIAEHIGGTLPDFVKKMNDTAQELGAKNSYFLNPSGLDEEGHLTSAYDMALITRAAMALPEFNTIWGTPLREMPPTNKQSEIRYLHTQNRMMIKTSYYYEGVIGGKLGWTTQAQNTMVMAAQKGDRRLLCVLLKSQAPQEKYQDAQRLFDYGFQAFRPVTMSDFDLPGQVTLLLHETLEPEVIEATCQSMTHHEDGTSSLPIEFRLKENKSGSMYPYLGAVILTAETPMQEHSWSHGVAVWSLLFLKILLGLFVLLFLLACIFRTRRRLRRRRRRLQRLQSERSRG